MTTISINVPDNIPTSEVSQTFLQGMADRMSASYCKYGLVAEAYPSKVDALKSLQLRLDRYAATGNADFLMDAANFAMIEVMCPRHPDAHFRPTDASGSPGRVWHGETDPSQLPNDIRRHV